MAELRTVLNNAQQLDFGPQLEHWELLVHSLDQQLQEVSQRVRSGQPLRPSSPSLDSEQATRSLRQQCRLLNSTIAQVVSATHSSERGQGGPATLEMVQALGDFTDSVEDVAAIVPEGDGRRGEERMEESVDQQPGDWRTMSSFSA